jgi:hypothetical protein
MKSEQKVKSFSFYHISSKEHKNRRQNVGIVCQVNYGCKDVKVLLAKQFLIM